MDRKESVGEAPPEAEPVIERAEPARTLEQRLAHITQPTLLSLLGMLAFSYMVYYFAGVNLEIMKLPSVVYFWAV